MARNTILLRGEAREEAGKAILYQVIPGMLMEPVSTGWQPHSTAGGAAVAAFAREQHENNGADIDTAIAINDEVTVIFPEKGAKINAYTADTIAVGGFVQSGGDGTVVAYDSGVIIGIATAASDLTGTYGRVEIVII